MNDPILNVRGLTKQFGGIPAMDAFHQVIFFHKGMDTLVLHYAVFLGYTALFSFLAIKYFKVNDK